MAEPISGFADWLWKRFNDTAIGLVKSPSCGRLFNRNFTYITYVGRKSGNVFTLPVGYTRGNGNIVIRSLMRSDRKSWWRNFRGDGAPISIWLDGRQRRGHAVATRHDRTRVTVTVTLVESC